MKKKKVFSKILAVVLVLSLTLTTLPSFFVFAQETVSKEQLTEEGELWQPESDPDALTFVGDLSLDELKTATLKEEDTPEIVSRDAIEEKGHVNRLWEQEEDLNSIVFQNRDGTKTMYYYNYPVKYKDANGKIKDKSNKISQTSSGDYTNAENDINTYFPKKLNRNKGIELKFGEYVVEMAPDIKGNSGASRQTGHNKYFDPTEYVQYPNVFGEGISLRYTPTFEGYKEDIVLSEHTGMNEFSFRLYTDGLSLVMNEDGSYCLIDPLTGEIKTQIGDLVVYDSKPFDVPDEILNESVSNPTEEDYAKKEAMLKEVIESVPNDNNLSEERHSNLKTYSHQYKVETVKQDNEYLITIVVDEEYLTDSERVYPVYVDPTLRVNTIATDGTKAILDAPIYSGRPSFAHGANRYNVIGNVGTWNDAYHGVGRTLVKFPGLMRNSFFQSLAIAQISSVNFHMRENSGLNSSTAKIDAYIYYGGSWNEESVKCNTYDWSSYTCLLDTENFAYSSGGWANFDITYAAKSWKAGTYDWNTGIILKNQNETNTNYYRSFSSTEYGGSLPYIEITIRRTFYTTVNNYYDNAFNVRYSSYGSRTTNLQTINAFANSVFKELFNINITNNTPSLMTSTADSCKTKQGLTINSTTIDQICPGGTGHTPSCTSWNQSYIDFINNVTCSDTPNYISILWTGNMLFDDFGNQCNRSFAWYRNGITMQEIINWDNYYATMQPILIHELAHKFGAPDHYHEIDAETGQCKHQELCSDPECNESGKRRPEYCIMNKTRVSDITTRDVNDIFCDGCKEDILAYLNINY